MHSGFAKQIYEICSPCVLKPINRTYRIAEKDMLEVIQREIEEVDWEAVNRRLRERIYRYKPVDSIVLTEAKDHRVRYVDPTWYLPFDIKDAYGNVLYSKGTAVNPLEKVPEAVWSKRLYVFFSLESRDQRDFVKYLLRTEKNKLITLIADGHSDLKEIHDFIKRELYPVYALTKTVAQRFGVSRSLSLVSFIRRDGKPVVKVEELPSWYIRKILEENKK
jgi:hypothetical protein